MLFVPCLISEIDRLLLVLVEATVVVTIDADIRAGALLINQVLPKTREYIALVC